MRNAISPNYAPDGFSATRQQDARGGQYGGEMRQSGNSERRQEAVKVWSDDDRHDDGLVHGHSWAMSGPHQR
jgi:hypothetical protein